MRDGEALRLVLSARMESARARAAAAVFLMTGAEFVSLSIWPVIWLVLVMTNFVVDRGVARACLRRRGTFPSALVTEMQSSIVHPSKFRTCCSAWWCQRSASE